MCFEATLTRESLGFEIDYWTMLPWIMGGDGKSLCLKATLDYLTREGWQVPVFKSYSGLLDKGGMASPCVLRLI